MAKEYTPEQFKQDPEFINLQDVIDIALDKNKLYSKEAAKEALDEVLNKEVY